MLQSRIVYQRSFLNCSVSIDDIDITKPISRYGIDSMVAAELRNWLFANFAKDVPLAYMLDVDTSVLKLEELLTKDA